MMATGLGDHAIGRPSDGGGFFRSDDRVELDGMRAAAAAASSPAPSRSASWARASRCWSATGEIAATQMHQDSRFTNW